MQKGSVRGTVTAEGSKGGGGGRWRWRWRALSLVCVLYLVAHSSGSFLCPPLSLSSHFHSSGVENN